MRSSILVAILAAPVPGVAAAACSIDGDRLYRGERAPFTICGPGIPQGFRLDGLASAGIRVEYAQRLGRCAPERRGPGLYVWLSASAGAVPAQVSVRNADTGAAVCDDLPIDVPDQAPLGNARLQPVGHPDGATWRLDVEAGDSGPLDTACAGGLEFPPSPRAPVIRLLTDEEALAIPADHGRFGRKKGRLPSRGPAAALTCTHKRLTAYVRITGQQRLPARVVVRDLGGDRPGRAGIALVSLPPPAWADSMRDTDARFVDVDGYRTRYFDKGKGPDTLVLVHGGQPDPISPTAQSWRPNFDALAREFRVVAFDNLGHGYTDNPRNAAEYAAYFERAAQHLYAFMQALGLQRVHLVGHSQGGWPVIRVALDHPELVRCVVSAGTVLAPFTRDARGVRNFAYMISHITPRDGPTIESMFRGDEFVGFTSNNLTWDMERERLALARRPEMREGQAGMAAARMSPGHPVFQSLRTAALDELSAGKLRVPHLVIWGREDPMADYELGLRFYEIAAAGAARTDLRVFNRAGHSVMLEYPEAFNSAVVEFCGAYRLAVD